MSRSLLILLLATVSFVSCRVVSEFDDLEEFDVTTQAEASRFVDSLMKGLRTGTLNMNKCPDVQWVHIPALFEYGQSREIVGEDPANGPAHPIPFNPISSMLIFQVSEGMFALWMIEAARFHTLNPSQKGFGSWPSQLAVIRGWNVDENGVVGPPIDYPIDSSVQDEVYAAYARWWKDSKGKKSYASVNPLEGTIYYWL
ncbi:MAG: hypothetical protein IJ636_07680 [Bacteroidales bacterium]|nr:hypothetical protein [Bacteroidales bacterium]